MIKYFRNIISLTILILLFSSTFAQENNKIYHVLNETVTDYDGNIYQTVKIGEQVWMLENLRVTHYKDGTPILNLFENIKWTNNTEGAFCLVNKDSTICKKTFGLLYNFYAVDNKHGLSPQGWHIPTEEEFKQLVNYLGGNEIAGIKIKSDKIEHWNSENYKGTNESGFSGLPAGGRGRLGETGEFGNYATWWLSTSYDSLYAWHWGTYQNKSGIRSNPGHKASGFSVRCIKD